jgi:hypothetical protein
MHPMVFALLFVVAAVVVIFLMGIRIVRPTHRGLVERLGKYRRFADRGFNWIIPLIDRMIQVNITEQMVDAQPQEIITNDNLNARVDAQVYFKVKEDEESVKSSQYNVNNYQYQIVNLCAHDTPQYHRHAHAEISKQRERQDQRRASDDAEQGDHELGNGDRQDRVEGNRPSQGRPGDDEQGGESGE